LSSTYINTVRSFIYVSAFSIQYFFGISLKITPLEESFIHKLIVYSTDNILLNSPDHKYLFTLLSMNPGQYHHHAPMPEKVWLTRVSSETSFVSYSAKHETKQVSCFAKQTCCFAKFRFEAKQAVSHVSLFFKQNETVGFAYFVTNFFKFLS
jgi:hypothetical protein